MLAENINVQNALAPPTASLDSPAKRTRSSTRSLNPPPTNDYTEELNIFADAPEESSTLQTLAAVAPASPVEQISPPPSPVEAPASPVEMPASPVEESDTAQEPPIVAPAVEQISYDMDTEEEVAELPANEEVAMKPVVQAASPVVEAASPVAEPAAPSPTTQKAAPTTTGVKSFYTEQYSIFCTKLDAIPALEKVETLTGQPKGVVVGSTLGVIGLVLALSGVMAFLVNDVAAVWFPAVMTLTTLTATTAGNNTDASAIYWAKYWVVFTSLRLLVDPVCASAVWFVLGVTFPYDLAKMGLLIWMMTNQATGASLVFERVHMPVVSKIQAAWAKVKGGAMEKLEPLLVQFGVTNKPAEKSD